MGYHLHPDDARTIAHWPLQSDLSDTSGNSLTGTMETGTQGYIALDSGLNGFNFSRSGSFDILAPSTALLRITGSITIEFLAAQHGSSQQIYVDCESFSSPGGNHYCYLWGYGSSNQHTYEDNTGVQKFMANLIPTDGAVHHFAMRRSLIGSGPSQLVEMFVDGVKQPFTVVTGTPTSDGSERVRVGGATASWGAYVATFRIMGYARSDADILADARFTLGFATPPTKLVSTYIPDPTLPYRPFYYLKITGLPYYFGSGIDPTDAKWGAAQWTLPAGYTWIKGMDTPNGTFDQALPDLIGGIATAERVTFSMMDFNVVDSHGPHSFFGRLLSPGRVTSNPAAIVGTLADDILSGAATGPFFYVRGGAGVFTGQDTYIGGETMGVSSASGPDGESKYILTVSARNKYPCHPAYPPNPSYAVPLDDSGQPNPDQAVAVSQGDPISFINRSAALYIGHLTNDGFPEPETNSLCRLIGHVKSINYGRDPGKFEFTVESVLADLAQAKVAPRLAHATISPQLYLQPTVWRAFTLDLQVTYAPSGPSGQSYTAGSVYTFAVDNGSGNNYNDALELVHFINASLPVELSISPDGSHTFNYSLRALLGGDPTSVSLAFQLALPPPPGGSATLSTRAVLGYPNDATNNATVGLLSAMGFPPGPAIMAAQPDAPDKTIGAVAPRSAPICFVPISHGEGVVIGLNDNSNLTSAGFRFFTDQGDGSGWAFLRYSDGQVGRLISTSATELTVGRSGKVTDGGTFYYIENGGSPSLDQILRIPSPIAGSAETGLMRLLASKGYDADGEFNVFPDGVGLGLDGILDKESLRNAAYRFTTAFSVDIDATVLFTDLWTGLAKEQGLWLVWDPSTAAIALRVLKLANYVDIMTPAFTESNRSTTDDRSKVTIDTTNIRTGWTVRYGWDAIQKKFTSADININDSFAANNYSIASRTETIEDRLIPANQPGFVNDTMIPALFDRSIFTRYPWMSVTRTFNKTGLLLSPGQYHQIVDKTLFNPFTGTQGIALTDNVFGWVMRVQSVLETAEVSVTFLIDQTTDGSTLRPWSPTGLLNFVATANGYDNATGICSMASWYTQGDHDGVDFRVGDAVALTTRDTLNSDGTPSYYRVSVVAAVAADGTTVTIAAGLGSVSSVVETILVLRDWGAVPTDRQTGAHRTAFQGSGDALSIESVARLHKWG